MYSHIIGMDEELRDILEEGVGNLRLDEEGVALDWLTTLSRKSSIRNII